MDKKKEKQGLNKMANLIQLSSRWESGEFLFPLLWVQRANAQSSASSWQDQLCVPQEVLKGSLEGRGGCLRRLFLPGDG